MAGAGRRKQGAGSNSGISDTIATEQREMEGRKGKKKDDGARRVVQKKGGRYSYCLHRFVKGVCRSRVCVSVLVERSGAIQVVYGVVVVVLTVGST